MKRYNRKNSIAYLFILTCLILYILNIVFMNEKNINRNIVNVDYSTISVDVSHLKKGGFKEVSWGDVSIGIYRRRDEDISSLFESQKVFDLTSKAQKKSKFWKYKEILMAVENKTGWINSKLRSIKQDFFIAILRSPIRDCPIKYTLCIRFSQRGLFSDHQKCFFDTCTGISFDMAGRVYKNSQYTNHLLIPNYRFLDDNTIEFFPNEGDVYAKHSN